jgi:hypothetical protein
MTQTAVGKTKIAGWQAPVSVITYGIYLAQHITTGIFQQMIAPSFIFKNVKILETSAIIFLGFDYTLLHL